MLFSPTSGPEQAGSIGSKTPFQKFTKVLVQWRFGPASFDSTNYKMFKINIFAISKLIYQFFASLPACPVYGELPVSKHPQQKAREYIYICSQNTRFTKSCPIQSEIKQNFPRLSNSLAFSLNIINFSLFASQYKYREMNSTK